MTDDHTKQLFESAPILYGGRRKPLTESLMSFGFMCGDGWYWPLLTLSENLEGLNVELEQYGIWIEATEVKEKFGTLRFYIDIRTKLPWYKRLWNIIFPMHPWHETHKQDVMMRYASNTAEELIRKCEEECHNRCEFCGTQFGSLNNDDRVVTKGWIFYICKKCADEKNLPHVQYYKRKEVKDGYTKKPEGYNEGEGREADSETH